MMKTLLTAAAVALVVLVCGCGGSSKPGYCSDVTDLKNAVSGLTDVQVVQNGVSSLTAATQKVQHAGQKLVSSAKKEFGPEASTLQKSIAGLGMSVGQLADAQTRKAALQAIPADVGKVKDASAALISATKSKCS